MSGPRILHVSQPTSEGVAVCVHRLARYQRTIGIDARVACPPVGDLPDWLREDGVPAYDWAATRAPGWTVLDEARRLARLVTDLDPDVVHLHSAKAGLAGRLALRGRRPTVVHPNGWSFHPPGPQQPLARSWERLAGRWAHLHLLASDAEADLGRATGVRGAFATVPNGVDPARFRPPTPAERRRARADLGLAPDDRVAVTVGRVCHQKGQDVLLAHWPAVRHLVPGARLLLVGDGPDRAALEASAPAGVRFDGTRADVRPWLWAADVVVQPSRWEGLSFVTLEALACGRPVVAFAAPGMAEAIGPDAGAVVAIGDGRALEAAVATRLADPDRAAAEGRAGRGRVEAAFTEDHFCVAATDATVRLVDRQGALLDAG